jgi:hypothetical protein
LSEADVIVGVKEVPIKDLLPDKTYLFFSHTYKGQKYNMPMLKKILDNVGIASLLLFFTYCDSFLANTVVKANSFD